MTEPRRRVDADLASKHGQGIIAVGQQESPYQRGRDQADGVSEEERARPTPANSA